MLSFGYIIVRYGKQGTVDPNRLFRALRLEVKLSSVTFQMPRTNLLIQPLKEKYWPALAACSPLTWQRGLVEDHIVESWCLWEAAWVASSVPTGPGLPGASGLLTTSKHPGRQATRRQAETQATRKAGRNSANQHSSKKNLANQQGSKKLSPPTR